MLQIAQTFIYLAFGLFVLALLAAFWQLNSAEPCFYACLGVGIPGIACLLIEALGWRTAS